MSTLFDIGKALSRREMKELIAGSSGGCDSECLICVTPGGTECWYRPSSCPGSSCWADSVCHSIYPAYDSNEVWGGCGAYCPTGCKGVPSC